MYQTKYFGGFSPQDGTIDFYGRVNSVITSTMLVIDLGAGRAGWFEDDPCEYRRQVRTLRGKAATVIAVDVDPIVLRNRAADQCLVMDDGKIPVDDEAADVVVADYVLEHVVDIERFVAEVNRVLKPGGHFCARTPHKWHYVSCAARLLPARTHSKLIKALQPNRHEKDMFPTVYRLNTIADIKRHFPNYIDTSFIYRTEPDYCFNSPWLYNIKTLIYRLLPTVISGNVFVFLTKPRATLAPSKI